MQRKVRSKNRLIVTISRKLYSINTRMSFNGRVLLFINRSIGSIVQPFNSYVRAEDLWLCTVSLRSYTPPVCNRYATLTRLRVTVSGRAKVRISART